MDSWGVCLTWFDCNSLTSTVSTKLHIFSNKITDVSITIITLKQQACIMFLTYFMFFLAVQKRSVELCKQENKACLQD